MPDRRDVLRLTAAVATMGLIGPDRACAAEGAAQGADSSSGAVSLSLAESQQLWARLNGDLSGRTVYFTTVGEVWGFRPQADDLQVNDFAKKAYGYAGVAARKMSRRADGAITVRQKSWAFYRDPDTERLGDRIPNRWTGAVDLAPPLSGPVSEQVLAPFEVSAARPDPYGMRIQKIGDHAFVSTANMIRFKPRDAGWFKLEGNLASHHCRIADLQDPSLSHVPSTCTQNLVAEWQTWTHMHGEPGHILFRGDGVPLFDAAAIPDDLQRAIGTFFPGQLVDVRRW